MVIICSRLCIQKWGCHLSDLHLRDYHVILMRNTLERHWREPLVEKVGTGCLLREWEGRKADEK
jgi:hypothetical protein